MLRRVRAFGLAVCLLLAPQVRAQSSSAPTPPQTNATPDLAPVALAASPDGRTLYLACGGTNQVLVFSPDEGKILHRWTLPSAASGLAVSPDGKQLLVTCAGPSSIVCGLDTASGKTLTTLAAGHTALSPVLSADGRTLFVCNRFNDDVSVFDLRSNREIARIPVSREPFSAALTRDGRFLLVANHLPRGRADVTHVAATVSVIDATKRQVVKELRLANGSIDLRQIAVAPDGKYAVLALTVARFQLPVTQLAHAWVNGSAITLIDLSALEVYNTVLLDDVERGAANPWGVAWSSDSRTLCVTHAGTHELSVIDFPALLEKLRALPARASAPSVRDSDSPTRSAADVPNDLSFLQGLRRRVALAGLGPRAVAVVAHSAWVAGYFSDNLDAVELAGDKAPTRIELNPGHRLSVLRRGELSFNDATISFQGWQSCASCHDDDGRVDGVQWDLLNDGIGNPKDVKSLVLSHKTPPVMSLGVRATAEVAVRSGIVNSLSGIAPEEVPAAIDEWLKSLRPAPSPRLENGQLSAAAKRGQQLFQSSETRCATCHEPDLFTDLRAYDVGTQNPYDRDAREFDTPTLRELWRTAPYLHDGSAATLRDVLVARNPKDNHGKTSHLTPAQVEDLVEYLLSL